MCRSDEEEETSVYIWVFWGYRVQYGCRGGLAEFEIVSLINVFCLGAEYLGAEQGHCLFIAGEVYHRLGVCEFAAYRPSLTAAPPSGYSSPHGCRLEFRAPCLSFPTHISF